VRVRATVRRTKSPSRLWEEASNGEGAWIGGGVRHHNDRPREALNRAKAGLNRGTRTTAKTRDNRKGCGQEP